MEFYPAKMVSPAKILSCKNNHTYMVYNILILLPLTVMMLVNSPYVALTQSLVSQSSLDLTPSTSKATEGSFCYHVISSCDPMMLY